MVAQRTPLDAGLRRLDAALRVAHVRQVTEREDQLQREWAQNLGPVLDALYWEPLYALNDAPEDEDELRAWLLLLLLASAARRRLVENLTAYQGWSANVGGAMALTMMGVPGGFALTNAALLDVLAERRARLTGADTGLSLLDTTADQLSGGIVAARAAGGALLGVLAGLIAGWVAARRRLISVTEMAWSVARMQSETYRRNGVAEQTFRTRGDERVCEVCAPLEGVTVRTNNIPATMAIPLHSGCRCIWEPVLVGWTAPTQIWRGA